MKRARGTMAGGTAAKDRRMRATCSLLCSRDDSGRGMDEREDCKPGIPVRRRRPRSRRQTSEEEWDSHSGDRLERVLGRDQSYAGEDGALSLGLG